MNSPSGASGGVHWRSDIASLVFPVEGHGAICAVHRGALRTLLDADPTPEACLGYFARFEAAFRAAAHAKIARKRILPGTNLHLTSRDIARKLLEAGQGERGEQP
ncbi:hypothetical protein [Bradyrhizobium sp. CCBAU 51753]|uniref:hypothetical protein n=1 Tax=Bradyrhizobium sp. CCBAU 51753 TaxID=1325100 RepID=UPI001889DFDF|nr:hypothetical protein [Bradyrhizobium sp. CCBAU 51753]QOZ25009.1 hypothetical protein XH93_16500 [Bradyrhizobium sp. CCBAU 51753]